LAHQKLNAILRRLLGSIFGETVWWKMRGAELEDGFVPE